MKILASELSSLLYNEGASLAGFGDISALGHDGYTSCVALAVKIPAGVIAGIKDGPAVRLSSVLTDAEFDRYAEPINASRCGGCTACTNACPGKAIKGALWDMSTSRESLLDVEACRSAARALAWERLHERITLCGKCIEVSPYTSAYLKKENML